jgi:general secretion pathway protein A
MPKPHLLQVISVTATAASSVFEHMFRSFGLKENPFSVSPDPRFLFTGRAYEVALAELMFGIESRRGLLVLTGEAGTGKTTVMRHFLQWLKDKQLSSSYIFHTHLDPAGLLEFILRDFGVPVESTKKSDLLTRLHHWLQAQQMAGDSPVIIIDEAQALPLRTLGELNQLLNLENERGKLVQMVLAGQPELEEKLRRPELRALRQRIMVRCRLPLLSLEETAEYIAARLRGAGGTGTQMFPQETVETIYSYASGVPRIVNLLCEHALIGAYADRQTVVSPENVHKVAAEFDMAGAPFAINNFDVVFPLQMKSRPAVNAVASDDVPPAGGTPVADSTVAVSQTVLASGTPALVVPMVVENVIAIEATAIESRPSIEASAFIKNAKPVEVAKNVAVSAVSDGKSGEATAAADIPAIAHAIAMSIEQSLVPSAVEVSAPEIGNVEVPDPEIAASTAEIPAAQPVTASSVESAPKEAAPAAATAIPVAVPAENLRGTSSESAIPNPQISPKPVLGPQLVKEIHAAPAVRAFAKLKKRHENRQPTNYTGWRKRRVPSPFQLYMRQVMESFAHDWREFISSFSAQIATFPRISWAGSDSLRRSLIDPVREWLVKPIPPRTTRDVPPVDRSKKS